MFLGIPGNVSRETTYCVFAELLYISRTYGTGTLDWAMIIFNDCTCVNARQMNELIGQSKIIHMFSSIVFVCTIYVIILYNVPLFLSWCMLQVEQVHVYV